VSRMKNIYNSGKYIQNNPSWHVEDSARNNIIPQNIAEIGCGAGMILYELLKKMERHVTFDGYEISPQAFKLTKKVRHERIAFHLEDLLSEENKTYYDLGPSHFSMGHTTYSGIPR
jgi:phospholipid N-methyltransferase